MIRVLLVGLGEVGRKHLAVLRSLPEVHVCGVVDTSEQCHRQARVPEVPWFTDHRTALRETIPHVVTIATPPGIAAPVAADALDADTHVLAEKPVVLHPDQLDCLVQHPLSHRVSVAFQTHLAPGVPELLARHDGSPLTEALVTLRCRRDRAYYTGWRGRFSIAGGVLHQQAIHGVALVLRLWASDDPVVQVQAHVVNRRLWKEPEDRIWAHYTFASGGRLTVDAQVDNPERMTHSVLLRFADGRAASVGGRNLELGVLESGQVVVPHVSHAVLRRKLYRAVFAQRAGAPCPVPCSLPELRRTLEVISRAYPGVPAAGRAAVRAAQPAVV